MRILMTGGAGTLGSNLIDRYLPQGHEILVIDNFATGNKGNVPPMDGLQVIEGSVADKDLVDQAFASFKPELVINSAAAYKDPSDWQEDTATNVSGSIYVAKAALEHGVKRLINFQTALAYGRPEVVPIPVSHPNRPFTSYGISKLAGENFLMMSGLDVVSLRLANITGPRLAIGPIPTFYQRLKAGKGCFCSETVRDFLDLEDFLILMDKVIDFDAPTGVFNVSTGEGKSIKDVFDAVVSYLGITLEEDVPIVPCGDDDVPAVVLDASETMKAFDWQPQYGFEETIERVLKWYDRYGVTDVFSHLSKPIGHED